jgi:hypothetical protein
MAIQVRVVSDRGLVHVSPTAPIDLEQAKEMLHRAAAAARAHHPSGVMLDVRQMVSRLTLGSLWHLAGEMAECAVGFRGRTAVLTTADRLEHGRFFALSCQNRGFEVRAFSDYDEALGWLQEKATGAGL